MRSCAMLLLLLLFTGRVLAQTCSGTPAAGSISASSSFPCPGTDVTITLSGQSAGSDIAIQWQTSADNVSWKNINSATGTSYVFTVSTSYAPTWYRAMVTCTTSGQSDYTAGTRVSYPPFQKAHPLPFTEEFEAGWINICGVPGVFPQPWDAYFAWVNWPMSGNSSWRRDDDYTSGNWSGNLGSYSPGGSNSDHSARFHSTYGTSGYLDLFLDASDATAPSLKKLSFDYINVDGDDKLVLWKSEDGGVTYTRWDSVSTSGEWKNKTIYFTTYAAGLVIRFMGVADNADSDIGLDNVHIEAVNPCSGTPVTGNLITDQTSLCAGASAGLQLDGVSGNTEGVTYVWEASTDDKASWQTIGGASGTAYTASQTDATWYRVTATCSFDNSAITSNEVQVGIKPVVSGNYTIDQRQPTSGNNFASFGEAYEFIRCGIDGPVVFDVAAGSGTYKEQLIINNVPGTSADNTVTFNGNGNTIYFTSSDQSQKAVVKLKGASYFIFNQLVINAAPEVGAPDDRYGAGVHLLAGASNNSFKNCIIISDTLKGALTQYYGILINGDDSEEWNSSMSSVCSNNVFEADTVIGGGYNVCISSSISGPVMYTRFTGNVFRDPAYRGISVEGAVGTTIQQNRFTCTGSHIYGPVSSHLEYVHLIETCFGTTITKNVFTSPFSSSANSSLIYSSFFGVLDENSGNIPNAGLVMNDNVIYDAGRCPNILGFLLNTPGAAIFHNTIDINYNTAAGYSFRGIQINAKGAGSLVKNNIVTITDNGKGESSAYYAFTGGVNSDNNVYYVTGTGNVNVGTLNGTAYKSLADWQAASGVDKYSVSANPAYVDVAGGDLHPTAQAVNNIGAAGTSVTDDITGAARNATAPDPGAYEFTPADCVPLHGLYTIDQNSPASATNFLSFNAAYAALQCGIDAPVVFDVKQGVYQEQLVMNKVQGASVVNTVTFKGNGNTLRYSSANSDQRAVIKLDGASHIIFDSLVIDAAPKGNINGYYGYGVQMLNDADSNVVRNCIIYSDSTLHNRNFNFAAIVITPAQNGLYADADGDTYCEGDSILNNRICGGDQNAVTVSGGVSGLIIQGNKIVNFGVAGVFLNARVVSSKVDGNFINRPARSENVFYGILVNGENNSSIDITRNTVSHAYTPGLISANTFGIYVNGLNKNGGFSQVTNNAVYNLEATGEALSGISLDNCNAIMLRHNTISIDSFETSSGATAVYGIALGDNVDGLAVNNIVNITRRGPGMRFAVYFRNTSSTMNFQNNDYYVSEEDGNYVGAISYTNQYKTLADWQAAVSNEQGAYLYNPYFTDLNNGDLTPTSLELDNKGIPQGIPVDIYNRPRSFSAPDPGAFEYTPSFCTTPPEAGSAIVTPNTGICLGGKVTLTVAGASSGVYQRYVWQHATSASGPWTDISDSLVEGRNPFITELTKENYFRCLVTCSGQTDSTNVVSVVLNTGMPAGVYTINNSAATDYPTGKNFNNFNEAVAAMACGIEGAVVFRAAAGTYNEQVRIPKIPNASLVNTVRFESASGKNTDVIVGYAAVGDNDNYVLKLDSASFVSFHHVSFVPGGHYYANAVVLSGGASWDTINGCVMTLPLSSLSSYNTDSKRITGVFADQLRGSHHVISNNSITNGSRGIYLTGVYAANTIDSVTITGNKIEQPFIAGIVTQYTAHTGIDSNQVHLSNASGTEAWGIDAESIDSAFHVTHNGVVADHIGSDVVCWGIKIAQGKLAGDNAGLVDGNFVRAIEENAGEVNGLAVFYISNGRVVNNVAYVKTTGSASKALNHDGTRAVYYNNTLQNASESTAASAGYFYEEGVIGSLVKNNIFSNTGGGLALFMHSPDWFVSDYNTLYTSGSTLALSVPFAGQPYATLADWRTATGNDLNSIVYKPAFANDSLLPDLNSADVWAIHGRGVQITGNNHDFYGAVRPETLQAGVPDMGAYEFLPVSTPVALTAVPAAPVAGQPQVFYFGTDTVARITWHAGSTVPSAVTMRRYSGVVPLKLAAGDKYMYFYTTAELTGTTAVAADMEQFYIDPWQGFIDNQDSIKLGRTNAAGTWVVNSGSYTDAITNVITEKNLTELHSFTGLLNGKSAATTVTVNSRDSSNAGTEFWASYGHHQRFETDNAQDMQLMISATDADAHVTVTVPGTGWRKEYTVTANTSMISDKLPKGGSYDARITDEGIYNRGIHIVSDVPVQVAAMEGRSDDVNENALVEESSATLLLPVGTYGYEYKAMITRQYASDHAWSWVNVIAAYDSTLVEITPSQPTRGGHAAGETYQVYLRKGEVYQIMGQLSGAVEGYELTGTVIRSAKNAAGRCLPVAVFSGSSATSVVCESGTLSTTLPVDNLVQQNLPYRAWGKHYITAPLMTHHDATLPLTSVYRVVVKDAATKVTVNGTQLNDLIDNLYYQFQSTTADDIVADNPVMVAQYMLSTGGCPGGNDDGADDAEVFYLTPVEHAVKKVVFFRHNIGFNGMGLDGTNTVSLIIPDAGVSTLQIDGANGFYDTYPCANIPGYTQVVKRWDLAGRDASDRNATFTISSTYPFTGVTYGLGVSESYGYNLGMLTDTAVQVNNTIPAQVDTAVITCVSAPVHLQTYVSVQPASVTWQLSSVAGATPGSDVTELQPAVKDSLLAGGTWYYHYVSADTYSFADTGIHTIPVLVTSEAIEGCDHSQLLYTQVYVAASPYAAFTVPAAICVGDLIQFTPHDSVSTGTIQQWLWDFGNGKTAATHAGAVTYADLGTVDVSFTVTSSYGCTADTMQQITVTDCRAGVFVPNAFTPNGDGKNDLLKVYGLSVKSMHLMIFNQWGQKIFETTNRDAGWDGTYKGTPQPSGVYMYVCSVTMLDGSEAVKKGAINLVR